MTHKSIVSLAVAAALLATTSLSSTAWAGGKGNPNATITPNTNRGGHDMTHWDSADPDNAGETNPLENVLYDDGRGNGGEAEDGGLVASEVGDFDPFDSDD